MFRINIFAHVVLGPGPDILIPPPAVAGLDPGSVLILKSANKQEYAVVISKAYAFPK